MVSTLQGGPPWRAHFREAHHGEHSSGRPTMASTLQGGPPWRAHYREAHHGEHTSGRPTMEGTLQGGPPWRVALASPTAMQAILTVPKYCA